MIALYKKICETFDENTSLFEDLGLTPIRMIDFDYGQMDNPDDFEMVFPAMFLSYSIQPDDVTEPNRALLSFDVLQEPGNATENFSPKQNSGLDMLRTLEVVKHILNALRSDESTGLSFNSEEAMTNGYYRWQRIRFECFIDQCNTSLTKGDTIPTELQYINIEYKK